MNEFDRLWQCAINLHRALHKRGTLTLCGCPPSVEIEVRFSSEDSRTLAQEVNPTEAVRSLIMDYCQQARERIAEIRRNTENEINNLNELLVSANQDKAAY